MSSYSGVACDDETDSARNQVLDASSMDSVAIAPRWYVEACVCAQVLQGLQEHSGGGLSIGVKVTPNGDSFARRNGTPDVGGPTGEIRKVGRLCRVIGAGIKKGVSSFGRNYSAPCESVGDQPVAPHGGTQRRRYIDR